MDAGWKRDRVHIWPGGAGAPACGGWRCPRPASPELLTFAQENASAPAISRQGNRLAYKVGRSDFNIWRVEVRGPGRQAGTTSRFISSTRFDSSPAYSPDGKRIAFVSDRSGNQEIWICDRDGSNQAQLTSVGGSLVRPPRWAPNSESIAFEADPDGNQDVYVVSANGGAPRRLTADRGADQWPDWSKDGQSLYYVRTRGGTKDIWKIPAAGGEAVPITRNANPDIPQASPDGSIRLLQQGLPESEQQHLASAN